LLIEEFPPFFASNSQARTLFGILAGFRIGSVSIFGTIKSDESNAIKSDKKRLRGGSQPEEDEMKKIDHFSYKSRIPKWVEIEIP